MSGIGQPELLKSVGVEIRHELKGVGENLRDHYSPRMKWTVPASLGMTYNDKARGIGLLWQALRYALTHKGLLGLPAAPIRAYIRTRNGLDAPDAAISWIPFLVGEKPVAVGGSRERGVVAAASYEARKFGVHSAMPSVIARRKCPDLIFVNPRFDVYKAISLQIREIFAEYTTIIEPLSLDEAYLDVTQNLKGIVSATKIAEEIRAQICTETELTASAGVSYNKFFAKLASDHRKPDGLFVITPELGPLFVETLPVRKFHGIGPATARKMEQLGIRTGLDLRTQTLGFLQQHFGKAGSYYYWAARGIDERPVRADRIRKSVGAENTFPADLFTHEAARDALREIVEKVWGYCERSGIRGRTVTLKVKFANFQQITRSRTAQTQIATLSELEQLGYALLEPLFPVTKGVRLLGMSLSSLAGEDASKVEFSLPL